MNQTTDIRVKHRIIKRNDIIEMARFFEQIAEEQGGKSKFHVVFRDGTSLEDDHASIMEHSYFKQKDTKCIIFDYISADYANRCHLHLEESLFFGFDTNEYSIYSEDETWHEVMNVKLADKLCEISKQSVFRRAFAFPWLPIVYMAIQVINWKMMPLLGFTFGDWSEVLENTPKEEYTFISVGMFFIIRLFVFLILFLTIALLYPEQEFAFGVSRHPLRMKVRKAFAWVATAILVPLALERFL